MGGGGGGAGVESLFSTRFQKLQIYGYKKKHTHIQSKSEKNDEFTIATKNLAIPT